MAQIENHEIKVLDKGIHCAGCEARIQSVLLKLPGVQEVKANYKTQNVLLQLDPQKLTVQAVKEKLKDLGYSTE
ncbi:MAG: heavy-metal-associated domain-containing protein [Chloroflexi bacterium]|nr:heavy-metal-associated domain-containing protein [Chloroflexota bacterium]